MSTGAKEARVHECSRTENKHRQSRVITFHTVVSRLSVVSVAERVEWERGVISSFSSLLLQPWDKRGTTVGGTHLLLAFFRRQFFFSWQFDMKYVRTLIPLLCITSHKQKMTKAGGIHLSSSFLSKRYFCFAVTIGNESRDLAPLRDFSRPALHSKTAKSSSLDFLSETIFFPMTIWWITYGHLLREVSLHA